MRKMLLTALAVLLIAGAALPAAAQSRVAGVDSTNNRLSQHIIGNKQDTAVGAATTTKSLMGYAKGQAVQTIRGNAIIDVSEVVATGFTPLFTLTPASSEALVDLAIDFDWNLATSGFDTAATAGDTLDVAITGKVDGTNYRHLLSGTQVTANGNGSLDDSESGERIIVGPLHVNETLKAEVKVSVERGDFTVPFRVTYRGPTPTVTFNTGALVTE